MRTIGTTKIYVTWITRSKRKLNPLWFRYNRWLCLILQGDLEIALAIRSFKIRFHQTWSSKWIRNESMKHCLLSQWEYRLIQNSWTSIIRGLETWLCFRTKKVGRWATKVHYLRLMRIRSRLLLQTLRLSYSRHKAIDCTSFHLVVMSKQ